MPHQERQNYISKPFLCIKTIKLLEAVSFYFNLNGKYRIYACISRTFFDKNLPSKIGVRLMHGISCPFATEPATPVLYVVKLPVESASV
jgi:hypothetical protein